MIDGGCGDGRIYSAASSAGRVEQGYSLLGFVSDRRMREGVKLIGF